VVLELAGAERALIDGGGALDGADEGLQLFEGDATGAQEDRVFAGEIEDGGFEADGAGAAVEDEGDGIAELEMDGLGIGGADAAEAVRARGGEGTAEGAEQSLGDGMGGDAERGVGQSAGGEVGDDGFFRENEGEGAGPEFGGEKAGGLGHALRDGEGGLGIGEVEDEGIEEGALFHLEDAGERGGVEAVGGKAVDGLGGQTDDMALAQERGGARNRVGRSGDNVMGVSGKGGDRFHREGEQGTVRAGQASPL